MDRVYEYIDLAKCRSMLPEDVHGFETIDLNHDILLRDGDDYALFEVDHLVYTGHYFFKSRGRQAYEKAIDFIDYVFNNYPCRVIKGLTPLHNIGALRLTARLGFKNMGDVMTVAGPMRLSILEKENK